MVVVYNSDSGLAKCRGGLERVRFLTLWCPQKVAISNRLPSEPLPRAAATPALYRHEKRLNDSGRPPRPGAGDVAGAPGQVRVLAGAYLDPDAVGCCGALLAAARRASWRTSRAGTALSEETALARRRRQNSGQAPPGLSGAT